MPTLLQGLRRNSDQVDVGALNRIAPLREIRLIGSSAPVGESGEQIERFGREYAVASTQARADCSAFYTHVGPL